MQSLSLKFGSSGRRDDWRCCFCCHVRTGTIFLGMWHLMLHVLAMVALAVMLCHPELMMPPNEMINNVGGGPSIMAPPPPLPGPAPALPTPLSSLDNDVDGVDGDVEIGGEKGEASSSSDFQLTIGQGQPPHAHHAHPHPHGPLSHNPFDYRRRPFTYHDLNVGAVVSFCTFSITALMVIGAIRGRPMYLMPFLCLQVFDFCIASLTAIGYVCYLPDVHRLVEQWPRAPFQSELLRLSPQCLSLLVLFSFMLAMLVKAYFIGVVWSCYRYLSLRLLASQRTVHYIDPDVQTLLPDYETAIKKFPAPPPSYATATAAGHSPRHPATAATLVVPAPPPQQHNRITADPVIISPPPYPFADPEPDSPAATQHNYPLQPSSAAAATISSNQQPAVY